MICGKKEEEGDCSQAYQEQLFLYQQMHNPNPVYTDPYLPWPVHQYDPAQAHGPFINQPAPYPFGGLFNSRGFGYEDGSAHLRLGSAPFGLQAELGKMTAQEIMDAKALAASKSHSEAERRRRERINNHLAKLRSLLPSTTKTDKASLLAEVIQHVKELKRQTSAIAETSPIPTEVDELMVDASTDEEGRFVVKASLCCEDRPDLLQDLIKTLKALKMKTLKAEITTLGGRVRNILFITGEDEEDSESMEQQQQQLQYSISSIEEALKAVMEKANGDESSPGSVKRQRTNMTHVLEHRSI